MEKTDHSSLQEGENQPPDDEEDVARQRSLQLGGGGLKGPSFIGRYTTFLGEVREELKKVTWPTRKMVVTETIVVLLVTVLFTLMITGLDKVFAYASNAVLFGK